MAVFTTESQGQREREGEEKYPCTSSIIAAAIAVHRELGPGLLESAYEQCLCHELHLREITFERQIDLPVAYKGLKLECGYKLDLIVGGEVVVELKSIERILPVHETQLLTCMEDFAQISRPP